MGLFRCWPLVQESLKPLADATIAARRRELVDVAAAAGAGWVGPAAATPAGTEQVRAFMHGAKHRRAAERS